MSVPAQVLVLVLVPAGSCEQRVELGALVLLLPLAGAELPLC